MVATTKPQVVVGKTSPNPTVVEVTTAHQNECGIERKGLGSFSSTH
jgi:hypothetical protein